MKNYLKFDRYELFTEKDRDLILDVTVAARNDNELRNTIAGLFDGYLYNDILEQAKGKISEKLFWKLSELVKKITDLHEQDETEALAEMREKIEKAVALEQNCKIYLELFTDANANGFFSVAELQIEYLTKSTVHALELRKEAAELAKRFNL